MVIGLVYAIEGVASMSVNQKQLERAVLLFAWADAMREKIGDRRPPVEQASVEHDLEIIHSEVNDSDFARLCAEGQKTDRLIQILTRLGADHYLSGPSARSYIEEEKFQAAGIKLEYMEYNYPQYPQLYPPFDPYVSVLDLLFMTGPEAPRYLTA